MLALIFIVIMLFSLQTSQTVDPEVNMTAIDLIRYWGYPAEVHEVTTEDGYILSLFRIPHGRFSNANASCRRPPILLVHGVGIGAAEFILNLPESTPGMLHGCDMCAVAQNETIHLLDRFPGELLNVKAILAFILADAGFDVFLLNHRGTTYSRRHETLTTSKNKYWQFSIDELAKFDAPAAIDKVLELSGANGTYWIGHSQGTAVGYMTLAERPEYNRKVKALLQLTPTGTGGYVKGVNKVILSLYKAVHPILDFYRQAFGAHEVTFNLSAIFQPFVQLCKAIFPTQKCTLDRKWLLGPSTRTTNETRVPVYRAHTKLSTSSWNVLHWAQMASRRRVELFDYSPAENVRRYGQITPPAYDYSLISVPVYHFWSGDDWISPPEDIEHTLLRMLRRDVVKGSFEIPGYNHADFALALDCGEMVFKPIVKIMALIATVDDIDNLHEFMLTDFLTTEPLSIATGNTRDSASSVYRFMVEQCAPSGVSTVCRDAEGTVIGMNLCTLVQYGEIPPFMQVEDTTTVDRNPIGKLMRMLNTNKWDLIPRVGDKLLYIEVLSVDRRYRGRGLAQTLLNLSYEKARAMGASGVIAECISLASQKLFSKTGYEVLREIQLDEILGEDGMPVLVCGDGTTSAQLVFKRL